MFQKTTISEEQQTTTQSIPANLASYQVEYSHSPIPQVHQTQFINPGTGYNSPVSQTHQHGSSTPPIMIPNMMQMAPSHFMVKTSQSSTNLPVQSAPVQTSTAEAQFIQPHYYY